MGIELTETNGKMLSVSQNDKTLRFMIPRSDVPFGFAEFVPPNGNPNVSLEFSLDDAVLEKVKRIEDDVIQKLVEKSQSVFKRTMTEDEVREVFNSNVRDGRLRVKHTRTTRLFNSEGKPIPPDARGGDYRGWTAAASVTIGSVYFFNRKVGLVWNADQIKFWEPEPGLGQSPELKGFAFTFSSS